MVKLGSFLLLLTVHLLVAKYSTRFHPNVRIRSFDGVVLQAQMLLPVPTTAEERFPVLLYPNSWDLDKWEYIMEQVGLAAEGFITLGYTARGWWGSGGIIDIGGPADAKDVSAIIDWVLENNYGLADHKAIGMIGVSYGGMLGLLGAAHDPRVRAVVSFSGPADITSSLYPSGSPSIVWASLLIETASIFGQCPAYLLAYLQNLRTFTNVSEALQWAESRSPLHYVADLNRHRPAIMIGNSFEDALFPASHALALYKALTVPFKRMDLSQGMHGTAEISGLLNLRGSYLWTNVRRWMNLHLRHIPSSIAVAPRVTMQLQNLPRRRAHFSQWPSEEVRLFRFYLGARGDSRQGTLTAAPNTSTPDTITHMHTTHMGAGMPFVGDAFKVYAYAPILCSFALVPHNGALIYSAATFSTAQYITGAPILVISVRPSHPRFQLNCYLYASVPDTSGRYLVGELLTHGTHTEWEAVPGRTYKLTIQLHAVAYRLPYGHGLVLGLNTHNELYAEPSHIPYKLDILYASPHPLLSIPVAWSPVVRNDGLMAEVPSPQLSISWVIAMVASGSVLAIVLHALGNCQPVA